MAVQANYGVISRVLKTVVVLVLFGFCSSSSSGVQYSVGDSLWTIPPYPYYFSNWSSSHFFKIGDSLVFDFETGRYDVIQVSRLDYELCTVWNPIRIFYGGPAIISLTEPGVFYFICNFSNYCDLGLKISISVHRAQSPEPNPPSRSPSPAQQPPNLLAPPPAPIGRPGSPPENAPSAHKSAAEATMRISRHEFGLTIGCVFVGLLSSFVVEVLEFM